MRELEADSEKLPPFTHTEKIENDQNMSQSNVKCHINKTTVV
jgi:hypothetical protein